MWQASTSPLVDSLCVREAYILILVTLESRKSTRETCILHSRSDPRSLPRGASKKYDTLRAVYTVENHHTLYIQYLIESIINYGYLYSYESFIELLLDSYSINFCLKNLSLFYIHILPINLYLLPQIIIDLSSLL